MSEIRKGERGSIVFGDVAERFRIDGEKHRGSRWVQIRWKRAFRAG